MIKKKEKKVKQKPIKQKIKKEANHSIGDDFVYDNFLSAKRSAKLAWVIAIIAIILAILSVVAIMGLTPLKTVKPFVFRVDSSTGMIEAVTQIKEQKITKENAMKKHWVARYVLARESYMFESSDDSYKFVSYLSSKAIKRKWQEYFNPKLNKKSPINLYAKVADIKTEIRSVVLLEDKVAQVLFRKIIQPRQPKSETTTKEFVATVVFDFFPEKVETESYLFVNPLGFRVEQYQTNVSHF